MSRGLRPPKVLPLEGGTFAAPNPVVDGAPKGDGLGVGAPNPAGAFVGVMAAEAVFGEGNAGMLGPPKGEAEPPNGAAALAPKAGGGALPGPNGEGEGPGAPNGEASGGFWLLNGVLLAGAGAAVGVDMGLPAMAPLASRGFATLYLLASFANISVSRPC